jgi:aldehyde:ferredoxin oxidoreductase
MDNLFGYSGRLLRVDLTSQAIQVELLPNDLLRKYLGGVGLGAQILYQEVHPGIEWNSPENRLILASGPLAGTSFPGSGTFCVITKGPMTNLACSTQANGFWGAYLKTVGFDAVVITGKSDAWVYLAITEENVELRPAKHLLGQDTFETEKIVQAEIKGKSSVYSIGPAGEHLVRFACIVGDQGHIAAHNGVGAVFGSKLLKAVACARGHWPLKVADPHQLKIITTQMREFAKTYRDGYPFVVGTATGFDRAHDAGIVPVRNYTTNLLPGYRKLDGSIIRKTFPERRHTCWACPSEHCMILRIEEGKFAGLEAEEPEYECLAAWGGQIGQNDPASAIYLSDQTDRLGMDVNEAGWIIGWVMECYEKGILTSRELDGLNARWGDVDVTAFLLRKIAMREGVGDWLAEGVMHASSELGNEAQAMAVYTLKGASPRGHDDRAKWRELLDTCFSNTGTIEAQGGYDPPEDIGLPPLDNPFSPVDVAITNARMNWRRQFEDCLGTCRFCTPSLPLTLEAVSAVTSWPMNQQDAINIGRRAVNILRVFNIRHGLRTEMEAPSIRYSSAPVDGPAKGVSIAPYWDLIKRTYYREMGWDEERGFPLPQTLKQYGLEKLVEDLSL